jgi:hypothetical protein
MFLKSISWVQYTIGYDVASLALVVVWNVLICLGLACDGGSLELFDKHL